MKKIKLNIQLFAGDPVADPATEPHYLSINEDITIGKSERTLKDVSLDASTALKECMPKPILLWTNPNPLKAFSAQDISLSSSDWDVLEIFWIDWVNNNQMDSTRIIKGRKGRIINVFKANANKTYACERIVTYKNSQLINIANGIVMIDNSTFQSAGNIINDWAVPQYIIGWKTGLFD